MTSTQVVGYARRVLNAQKVGHAGTLDPLATGVLPLAFGEATKTIPYVMEGTKIYQFTLRFGESRDSDDAEGNVTGYSDVRPTNAQIQSVLPRLTGDILQRPPIFSALKIGGKRAYHIARQGHVVELSPRLARVKRFELTKRLNADTALFEVESGKGVYMRALARDLALACGTVGHIVALRRLQVGSFTQDRALGLDKLVFKDDTSFVPSDLLCSVEAALVDIPAVFLTREEVLSVRQGRSVPCIHLGSLSENKKRCLSSTTFVGDDIVRIMEGDRVIGIGRLVEGCLKPVRVFNF
ncbi:MAG: tRNA pseudouridine(55) synthase TruB [Acetobacter sp.]|nr:tRNA pseudouridine(55) synthase TruB [Acetobacter sp.]